MKKPNVLCVCALFPYCVQDLYEDPFFEKVSYLMTHLHAEPSIEVVDDPDSSDVTIVILDHYFEPFAKEVIELSRRGTVEIWAFVPRGVIVPGIISDEIHSHNNTQFLYVYDHIEDILRRIGRYLYDKRVVRNIPSDLMVVHSNSSVAIV